MEDGKIKEGTHLILSSTPDAGLNVEAISPGAIGSRKTTIVGRVKNPIMTAATFEAMIGANTIDKQVRENCLRGLVWCANGLRTNTRGRNADSRVSEIDNNGTELLRPSSKIEKLPLTTSIFKIANGVDSRPRRLLQNL